MSRLQSLKLFVNQRLNAAVEEIFGHFERTIIEYEEELERRHRKLLDVVLTPEIKLRHAVNPADVQQLLGSQEEVPPEQQEWSSRVEQEQPEPPHIKEEQEELWTSQEGEQLQGLEEADISKLPFPPVPVKSEDDEEKPQSSQLHQSPAEESREVEPLSSSSTHHLKTGADGDCCGDGDMPNSPEPDTDDSEDWKKARESLKRVKDAKSDMTCQTDKKQFGCSECVKTFNDKSNLNRHMRCHTGERPFSCSLCSRRFRQRSDLVAHIRIHTGEKPFSCSVCNSRFTQRNILVQHMRTHTGVKPFICSVCGKRFSQKGNMTAHMKYHTGEKPFGCNICDKRFTQKGSLKVHMRVHMEEKPFICSVCGKCFTNRGNVMSHMCNLHFVDSQELEEPLKVNHQVDFVEQLNIS